MATIFNLIRGNRWIEDRIYKPAEMASSETDIEAGKAFLSERGMILIACGLYCAFVWAAIFLWLFG
nr:hypothetical protein [Hyphomonas sp. Mor2]